MIANYQLTGANGINYLGSYAPGDGRTSYFADEKGNTLYSFGRDSTFKKIDIPGLIFLVTMQCGQFIKLKILPCLLL